MQTTSAADIELNGFYIERKSFYFFTSNLHGEHWAWDPYRVGVFLPPAQQLLGWTQGLTGIRGKMEEYWMIYGGRHNLTCSLDLEMGQLDLFIQEAPSGDWWGSLTFTYIWTVNPAEVLHTVPVTEENLSVSPVLLFPAPRAHLCNLCLIWEGKAVWWITSD